MSMKRIFLGLPLSSHVTEQLKKSLRPLQKRESNFFWIPEENWHITLSFLGDMADDEIQEVKRIVAGVAKIHNYFNMYFDGIAFFPDPRHPRKIVLTSVKNRNLTNLQFALRVALEKFIPEVTKRQRFFPHVSIANIKRDADQNGLAEAFTEIQYKRRLEVTEITFFETVMNDKPPVQYKKISEIPLRVVDKINLDDETE